MQCQRSPFFLRQVLPLFSTINLAYVQEINIFGRDYSNLRLQAKTFKSCNKWTPLYKEIYEDEEVYILNKGSYLNWKTI